MARTNQPQPGVKTHEGAPAHRGHPDAQLRRSVMSCMLWEDEFYEDGVEIATRIEQLVSRVTSAAAGSIAMEARTDMKLRHVPLLITAAMAKNGQNVRTLVPKVVQRADELAELLAIFARITGAGVGNLKKILTHSLKKGLADAFHNFTEYDLAKYDRAGAITLRDVLFLTHPKPENEYQAAIWKRLIDGKLETPDTWETTLSAGAKTKTDLEKRVHWTRLLEERKLGILALLRNLRNMTEANVDEDLINRTLDDANVSRALPFRFITAAAAVPRLEPALERAMFRSIQGGDLKLTGSTAFVVDCSASMLSQVSGRSKVSRFDAAAAIAIIARELSDDCRVYAFGATVEEVAPRRGFALRDAIAKADVGHSTYIGKAVAFAQRGSPDRIVVLTDDQSWDPVPQPGCKGYMINVASNKYGVDHGAWVGINGFSEAVLNYIQAYEVD